MTIDEKVWQVAFGIAAAVCAYLLSGESGLVLNDAVKIALGAVITALAALKPPKTTTVGG